MLACGDSPADKSILVGRCTLWLAAVESFDLRYNLRFKIIGAEVGVGGVKSIGSSYLSKTESKSVISLA